MAVSLTQQGYGLGGGASQVGHFGATEQVGRVRVDRPVGQTGRN
jgi:hypothetical protein